MIYQIKFTLDEIEDVAKSIINEINDVNLVLFKGELGSGKTTLIKSILKNLGGAPCKYCIYICCRRPSVRRVRRSIS